MMNASSHNADGLSKMTVSQLKELASNEGISLKSTRKADIINEILESE